MVTRMAAIATVIMSSISVKPVCCAEFVVSIRLVMSLLLAALNPGQTLAGRARLRDFPGAV